MKLLLARRERRNRPGREEKADVQSVYISTARALGYQEEGVQVNCDLYSTRLETFCYPTAFKKYIMMHSSMEEVLRHLVPINLRVSANILCH